MTLPLVHVSLSNRIRSWFESSFCTKPLSSARTGGMAITAPVDTDWICTFCWTTAQRRVTKYGRTESPLALTDAVPLRPMPFQRQLQKTAVCRQDDQINHPAALDETHVANIARLAAVITATVIHPRTAIHLGFVRAPITSRLFPRAWRPCIPRRNALLGVFDIVCETPTD
jgi:hypothetical protein